MSAFAGLPIVVDPRVPPGNVYAMDWQGRMSVVVGPRDYWRLLFVAADRHWPMFAAALRRRTSDRLAAPVRHEWAADRDACELCGETGYAYEQAR